MDTITLDFETYYDNAYSLSKMTMQEYICDPRYETIMVSYKFSNHDGVYNVIGSDVSKALRSIDWANTVLVAQNTAFDAAILDHHYGIRPKALIDTMSMAKALGFGETHGISLAMIAKALQAMGYDVPDKGTEVVNALGKRLHDFSPSELAAYSQYCNTDVIITEMANKVFCELLPLTELRYQSMILKAYTEPKMFIDGNMVANELHRVKTTREQLLSSAMAGFGATRDAQMAVLQSNDKFAQLLEFLGVDPPRKISKTTKKETYAFAKTDEEFQALLEHEDETVATVCEARAGLKSSISQTRCETFLTLSKLGMLRVPYRISGAHTGRLSGSDSMNIQNLPSGRVKGQSKELRRSLVAPQGYVLVAGDSAQIEPRVLAFMADDQALLDVFRTGGDPYSVMAGTVYLRSADDIKRLAKSPDAEGHVEASLQRQIGKAAVLSLGYQSGAGGFLTYCKTVAKVAIEEDEAKKIVAIYRRERFKITQFWAECESVLKCLIRGEKGRFGGPDGKLFLYDGTRMIAGRSVPGIMMPDGMWINYMGLKAEKNAETGYMEYTYKQRKGRAEVTEYIYGGKVTENLCQGLAYAAMKFQMVNINKRYPFIMNVHDETVHLVPQAEAEEVVKFVEHNLSVVPHWLDGCPLKGEVGFNMRYGDI